MEIVHNIRGEAVLRALNIEPASQAAIEHFTERYAKGDALQAGKETTPFFLALRSRYLRNFVDAWLQTGVRKDGSESPFERDLFRAPNALQAAQRHLAEHPPVVTFSPISRGLSVTFGGFPRGPNRPTNPFNGAYFDARRHFISI